MRDAVDPQFGTAGYRNNRTAFLSVVDMLPSAGEAEGDPSVDASRQDEDVGGQGELRELRRKLALVCQENELQKIVDQKEADADW